MNSALLNSLFSLINIYSNIFNKVFMGLNGNIEIIMITINYNGIRR